MLNFTEWYAGEMLDNPCSSINSLLKIMAVRRQKWTLRSWHWEKETEISLP